MVLGMKLLKIITAVFIIYFIRRFFQLYKAMKSMQEKQAELERTKPKDKGDVIEADFKVIK